jgi:hypothetical protein
MNILDLVRGKHVPVTHGNILHKITHITIVTLNKLLEEEDEHILDDDVLLEPQPE